MAKKDKLSDKQKRFLKEYAHDFVVAKACRRVGISRVTISNWRRDSREFETLMDGMKETFVDLSESVLFHTLNYGYKTDKNGNMVLVPTGNKTDVPMLDEKGQSILDANGEVVYMDELTHQYSKEAIDAAKFLLIKSKQGKSRGYADSIDINADVKAMQTKLKSREEVIDVTAEEIKQIALGELKGE